ncbi:hypothetical protein N0V90_000715 [Kalmusia sp. IMI 367209]|nr:hypothetical protein N0V90_000715 [Kalmusia sp. IMI 367209]
MTPQTVSPAPQNPKTQRTTAAFPFFNPTRALFAPGFADSKPDRLSSSHTPDPTDATNHAAKITPHSAVTYKWTSRNNRKGRHAISIDPDRIPTGAEHTPPRSTTSWQRIASGIWEMFTSFPVWDISYDVAVVFTLGSIIWVINAFFVWLPVALPDTEFKNEELYGGGITAFIGATIFEVGSFLLMAEAVNENRTACFGWALEQAISHDSEKESTEALHLRPAASHCTHHHPNKRNLVGKAKTTGTTPRPGSSLPANTKSWIWFPSMEELRTHYMRELGFLASFTQLLAASIFWVSGFTALPWHLRQNVSSRYYCAILDTTSHWWHGFHNLGDAIHARDAVALV